MEAKKLAGLEPASDPSGGRPGAFQRAVPAAGRACASIHDRKFHGVFQHIIVRKQIEILEYQSEFFMSLTHDTF